MPFIILENDITKVHADAIVNAANEDLLGGGGVDGCIHKAAGPLLLEECRTLGGCLPGEAKVTKAYDLPAKVVLHTVGPRWRGGSFGEKETLISCYRTCLRLTKELGLTSVAFPLISAGVFRYPKAEAFHVATETILSFLQDEDLTVYLVLYHRENLPLDPRLKSGLNAFLDEKGESSERRERSSVRSRPMLAYLSNTSQEDSLEEYAKQKGESFHEMLFRKIDEEKLTDAECYKRANIDRRLFSKIRSDREYQPSKPTVLALAIALRLSLEETEDFLRKAGFALSPAKTSDRIIEFFLRSGKYNIFEINEALFHYSQNPLGA